ncbi:DUF4402 domain-containing protein [Phenylobacterium deserti]|uniref:DUF4402 domain-containing protein n=1 Tax=Phenylobacterium deserti TaxID=1914756 RepID=A0A328A952_9CAUL|nr:DUF4402 domain-containing protein [Phenylobacterium deserti]RAK50857.1 hypothetical protein DJ018_16930 [Phenylobacterium deserti]
MRLLPAFFAVSLAAALPSAAAHADTRTGEATITAVIRDSAGVNLVTPFVIPRVAVRAVSTRAAQSVRTAASARSVTASNATLTIRGQAGAAMSMAVPETFTVVRAGGSEAFIVTTNSDAGGVLGGDTMSINVGGDIDLAGGDNLVPGPYAGLLLLVVQYN